MRTIAFVLLALASAGAWSQSVVMYRCTDAQGAVTLQNDVPCPKGSKQVKRVIETPSAPAAAWPPAPAQTQAPVPKSATPAMAAAPASAPVAPAAPPPAPAVVERQAPPDLYRCQNYRKELYFSDTDLPPSRCLPLQTTGLDGNPGTGAGAACEMVRDACQRIAEGALCDAWRQRLRDAESAVRFGTPEQAVNARAEFGRAEKVMRESTCAG